MRGLDGRRRAALLGLLLPYLLGALVLIVLPAVLGIGLAFTQFDGIGWPRWWGLSNFRMFYIDPLERIAVANSLYYTALAVPVRLLAALGLALLLRRPRRGVGLYRAAVFLPTLIPDVAYALIWLWVFNPLYGPLNLALHALGLPQPGWLASPDSAKLVFVVMAAFQIGEGFVALLAGLQLVPAETFDAATVDGARGWTLLRHITLPLLSPWLILLTFRDLILSFHATLTPALLLTGGDPYRSTLFLPLLALEESFDHLRFGMGGAILSVMLVVSGALALARGALLRRWSFAEDA